MADNAEVRINQGAVFTFIEGTPATPATEDDAAYALVYEALLAGGTEVGEIHDYGTYGGSRSTATHTPIKTGKIKKRGGSLDNGTLSIQFGKAISDAGQAAMTAAFRSNVVCSAKIVDNGYVEYFTGIVTNNEINRGDSENIITQSATMDLSDYIPPQAVV